MLRKQEEPSVGIICACLATLQPVLNATIGPCFGRVFATFHSTKKASAATSSSSGAQSSSSQWRRALSSNEVSRNQMSSGRGNSIAAANDDDRKRGMEPPCRRNERTVATNNMTTSAWTNDESDAESDDGIPLEGIRVQKDLEQNMQRGMRPGRAL